MLLQGLVLLVNACSVRLELIRLDQVRWSSDDHWSVHIYPMDVSNSVSPWLSPWSWCTLWCAAAESSIVIDTWINRGYNIWCMHPVSCWNLSDWIRSDTVMIVRVSRLLQWDGVHLFLASICWCVLAHLGLAFLHFFMAILWWHLLLLQGLIHLMHVCSVRLEPIWLNQVRCSDDDSCAFFFLLKFCFSCLWYIIIHLWRKTSSQSSVYYDVLLLVWIKHYIRITVIYPLGLQELQPLVHALIVRLELIRLDQVEWL